jgi:hypothetical protein
MIHGTFSNENTDQTRKDRNGIWRTRWNVVSAVLPAASHHPSHRQSPAWKAANQLACAAFNYRTTTVAASSGATSARRSAAVCVRAVRCVATTPAKPCRYSQHGNMPPGLKICNFLFYLNSWIVSAIEDYIYACIFHINYVNNYRQVSWLISSTSPLQYYTIPHRVIPVRWNFSFTKKVRV